MRFLLPNVALALFTICADATRAYASTIDLSAPSPANAAGRRAAFESRLDPDSAYLKEVADRFFSYLHSEITLEMAYGDAALRDTFNRAIALHREGRYLDALEAYRDGFMDRLAQPAGPMPQRPRLMMSRIPAADAIVQAERLMQDPLVLSNPVVAEVLPEGMELKAFLETTRDRVAVLHLALGTPGSINWTWTPEGITPVNTLNPERWVERHLGDVTLGFPLLRAYLETGDERYLRRYADIHDDRHMNWLGDVLASGRGLYIGVNDAEGYADEIGLDASLFGALRHLAIHRPESRRAFDALTLAQSLIRMYDLYLPVQMRLVRCITGNRLSHMYSQRLLHLGIAFPEFAFSDYLVREKRRAFEAYPVVSGYPDGHDVNWAYNYAFNDPGGTGTFSVLPHDPSASSYLSDEWIQLQRDAMVRRIRTLAHSLFINGTAPRWAKPDQDYSVRWRHVARREENRMFPR